MRTYKRFGVYQINKKYNTFNNYIIRINFNTEKIEYRQDNISEENGIRWGDSTTSNFANSENFVVLECIDRLIEKGYSPQNLYLEYKFPLGRNEKGKLDILVFDNEQKAYLMIECKTWGAEFTKEQKKMQKDGGQLFSYFVQDKATQYLCLYTSHLQNDIVEYANDIIKVQEEWSELNNQKEIHEHWNKNVSDNGIFEQWANTYDIEIKALVRGRLQPLTKDDSGRIFNQFAEILRHNVVSDKPNAFNKMLNLFICKIIDEDKNDDEQVEFQWLEDDTNESLQLRLNDLYKKGMSRFLNIDVTDFSENDISDTLDNIGDSQAKQALRNMIIKLRLQKNPEFAFIEVYDETSFKLNARVVKEVVELLQPYQFRYGHKQQFLGDFFELLLNTSIKQEAGQFFTPVPIARYIIYSLPIKEMIEKKIETDEAEILPNVIDFACGTGHFLTEYMDRVQHIIENDIDSNKAKRTAKKKLSYWSGEDGKFEWASEFVYGIDADYRLVKSTKVSSFLNGDGEANIIRANGLDSFSKSKDYRGKLKISSDSKDNDQFDILIANPPYSVASFKSTINDGENSFELFNKLTDNSSEIECLFVERMKQLLKVGGYAGIVLPSSILSNSGIYTATREIILKYFKIIAITELGSNTFMATGTNTIILFLERRANNDHIHIQNAINKFFENAKDVTVLGIEKAFSKYVTAAFEEITFDDYISFIDRKPSSAFCNLEIYNDYKVWFEDLMEIKNLKKSKAFAELSDDEQHNKLEKMFFDKVYEIEKDKILYFLLTYTQKTVITKIGEKQAEKEFLGYEFSKRRGHEGIKMLPNGTKLYDEENPLNPEKANSYIYAAFTNNYYNTDECLKDNISFINTYDLIEFKNINFEKTIDLRSDVKLHFNTKYPLTKLGKKIHLDKGVTYDKLEQVYQKTKNIILTADNITINNQLKVVKEIYLNDSVVLSDSAKLKRDDIFISVSSGSVNHVGKVAYIEQDMPYFAGGFMGMLRKNNGLSKEDNISMKYVYCVLSSQMFRDYITEISKNKGSNIKNLNDSICDIKIPFPPMEIQQKIVKEFEYIEKIEKNQTRKLNILKNSIMQENYFAYADERIEKIAVMIQRGKSAKYGTSNIQIIKSGQARGYSNFDFSQKYYVAESFVSDERNLQKGDILINSTGVGTAGRVTLFDLDGDFVVDSHITIVRIDNSKATPKYIMYALANIGFKNIEAMANGQSGQIELTLPTIKSIRVPLPPLDKQKEIVAEIETIEMEIKNIQDEIKQLSEQKKAILEKYL